MPFSHGQKHDPAVAAALRLAGRSRKGFGGVPGMVDNGPDFTSDLGEPQNHGGYIGLAQGGDPGDAPPGSDPILKGAIRSNVAGRTDHLPVHVESGSYVIPADIVSALGEGNTDAGFKIVDQLFGDPGGGAGGSPVPVVVAGGEYVITPAAVAMVGTGNIDDGHKILDEFVKRYRAKTVRTLAKLPGPKKD